MKVEERKKPGPEARVESGIRSESAPTAVLPVPVASAATTTSAAAEGAELELPVPAAAAASLAAVTATAVAGLALVFDRADVEGRVDVPDRLLRLRHRAVLSDVQSDVSAHEGHVAVVDEERLVLRHLPDLVVPEGQEHGCGLVPDRRFDELSCLAELRRHVSLFAQPDDLDQDVYLLGRGGQVFDFRHCFVHVLTFCRHKTPESQRPGKTETRRIQTMWADCRLGVAPIKRFGRNPGRSLAETRSVSNDTAIRSPARTFVSPSI